MAAATGVSLDPLIVAGFLVSGSLGLWADLRWADMGPST
jgi:hypothetical protein